MDANPSTSPTVGGTWLAGMVARGTLRRFKTPSQAVALHIAFTIGSGQGRVSVGILSKSSGLSIRTVKRSIHELERGHAIRVRRVVGGVPEMTLLHS